MQTEVTPLLVHQAAERIRPIAQRTPVLNSHSFDAESGDVAARALDIERVLLAADVPTRHFGVGPEPVE